MGLFSKQTTSYELDQSGAIVKYVNGAIANNDVEVIDGEVIDESGEQSNGATSDGFNFWSFFGFGGGREPFNDNGREYNGVTGNWEYTPAANGNANPFKSNYEAVQDLQGTVPQNDGY